MDWWRAKLVFLAAFLCLDLFLAWQVRQLAVPARLAAAGGQVGNVVQTQPEPGPVIRPVLAVQTVPWAPQDMALLTDGDCPQPQVKCSDALHDSLDLYGGWLFYTSPRPVTGWDLAHWGATVALQTIHRVDPSVTTVTAAGTDEDNGVYTATEMYQGLPVFNGVWRVDVGVGGIVARRFWVTVDPQGSLPAQTVFSADQAAAAARRIFGANAIPAGAHPVLGYYYPQIQPPGLTWYINAVWRFPSAQAGMCFFVNAADPDIPLVMPGSSQSAPQAC